MSLTLTIVNTNSDDGLVTEGGDIVCPVEINNISRQESVKIKRQKL